MAATNEGKGTGLTPNVASMLCYIPIVSIIIMLLEEKSNKEVQFHAWQGTGLWVLWISGIVGIDILSSILGHFVGFLGVVVGLLSFPIGFVAFILWVVCLVKAYQSEHWKIPYLGDFAEKKSGFA